MAEKRAQQSQLYIAGEQTLWQAEKDRQKPREVLSGESIRAVAAGAGIVVVALEGGKLVVMGDQKRTVDTQIAEPIESLLIVDGREAEVLIGTGDARLYRLRGDAVQPNRNFDDLGCRQTWHTPWGGPPAVRSMAGTPDGWVYADIHVGSIMRSSDRGEHWEPVKPELNEDVHQVATCRADANRVYADTAKAVYISYDRGSSWEHRSGELQDRYGRAIAVDPDDPDLVLATVSDGPHGSNVHGRLWRSENAGRSWSHVCDGFPESTRENINTFQVAFGPDGTAWAAVENTVYVGLDRARQWREWLRMDEPVRMLAVPQPAIGRV
ncbi:MAG: WD40/YVTN/BNR-like repeat-containing protein [Phycisphaerae bacterium]